MAVRYTVRRSTRFSAGWSFQPSPSLPIFLGAHVQMDILYTAISLHRLLVPSDLKPSGP